MDRSEATRDPRFNRSAVTNGKQLLPGVDGRSPLARRFRDIVAELTAELGGSLGAAEALQVRTAATLVVHSEAMAARIVRGEIVSAEEATRAGNAAIRAIEALKRAKAARKPRRTAGAGAAAYLAAKRGGE